MKKSPILVLLAVAAALAPAASCRCSGEQGSTGATEGSTATGTAVATLAETSFKLQNGLQADLASGACGDSVALAVLVQVGIDHDPPGRSGMANLAGRVLATSAGAGRAERTVETGSDYTLYSVVVPADRLEAELDEVAAWMKGAPAEADFGRERTKLVEELGKLSGDDAAATALSLAEEALLPTRGNGKRLGIKADVEAITLAELQAFWEAHLKPGNTRISVAGRFDAAKARGRIESAFGSLPAGTPGVLRSPPDSSVKGTLVMGTAPKAVAVAVAAPAMSDPLFGPFLVLAARLTEKSEQARTWEASYDPLRRPELLFVTGPVGQAEQPEPAAGRIRTEAGTLLQQPPATSDAEKARERFRLFLEPALVDPALCAKDARAFAWARARRAQLGVDPGPIGQALDATTREQLEEAAKAFEPKRSAAVIAGGPMR